MSATKLTSKASTATEVETRLKKSILLLSSTIWLLSSIISSFCEIVLFPRFASSGSLPPDIVDCPSKKPLMVMSSESIRVDIMPPAEWESNTQWLVKLGDFWHGPGAAASDHRWRWQRAVVDRTGYPAGP